MADSTHRRSTSLRGGRLVVVALLAPALVLPLCVPLYARRDPTLAGLPFFFWFQFVLIVGGGTLTLAAHLVARSVDRRDRAAHDLPQEPDDSGARRTGGDPR